MQYQPLVSQDELKTRLQSLDPADHDGRNEFWGIVMKEIENFDNFCKNSFSMLVNKLWSCIKLLSTPVNLNLDEILKTADTVADLLVKFSVFLGRGYRFFLRLRHQFDITGGNQSTVDAFGDELCATFVSANISYGDVICMFSDIYASINSLKYGDKQEVQSTAFNGYKVKKYFIKPDDVFPVKLAICSHLPVYRPGMRQGVNRSQAKPGRKYTDAGSLDNSYDNEGEGDITKISTVYLDNEKKRLYHDKIFRKEGSSIIRVKWDTDNPLLCTVERKRTSFALDKHSLSDKIDINWDRTGDYIRGNLTPKEVAKARSGHTFMSEDSLRHLASTIQKIIEKLRLTPVLQTTVSRASFQHASQVGIQIWIDTDINFCKESAVGTGKWCSNIQTNESTNIFPLAVMTLRVPKGASIPDWLKTLVSSEYIISECDFAKFLHGTSRFATFDCEVLPSWYCRPMTHSRGYPLSQWWRVHLNVDPNMMFVSEGPIALGGKGPMTKRSKSSSPTRTKVKKKNELVEIEEDLDGGDSSSSDQQFQKETKPLAPASNYPPPLGAKQKDQSIELKEVSSEKPSHPPQTPSAPTPTSPIWSDAPPPTKPKPSSKFLGLFHKLRDKATKHLRPHDNTITPMATPIRVEPKTYFANERTLLQWVNVSTFLAMGSFAFINYATDTPRATGIGILVIALLFVIYSLGVFHYRRIAIVSRSVDGHYDDKWGPTVLVIVLFAYIIMALVFQVNYVAPVPLTTASRAVREYRLPLSSSFLLRPDLTSAGLVELKANLQTAVPRFALKGSFSYSGNQTVIWYDTRASCVLKRNGFSLKEITGFNYSTSLSTNTALQYVTEDWEYINQLDSTYLTTFFNATEIVRNGNYFLYSREKTQPVRQNPSLRTLQNVAQTFSTFFLWDYVTPTNWGETLVPVYPSPLQSFYYGSVNALFGSTSSSTKMANIGVYVWYTPNFNPVFGELVVSFPIRVGRDLTKQEILDAKYFYTQISSLTTYFNTTLSTKGITDIIYDPSFCL